MLDYRSVSFGGLWTRIPIWSKMFLRSFLLAISGWVCAVVRKQIPWKLRWKNTHPWKEHLTKHVRCGGCYNWFYSRSKTIRGKKKQQKLETYCENQKVWTLPRLRIRWFKMNLTDLQKWRVRRKNTTENSRNQAPRVHLSIIVIDCYTSADADKERSFEVSCVEGQLANMVPKQPSCSPFPNWVQENTWKTLWGIQKQIWQIYGNKPKYMELWIYMFWWINDTEWQQCGKIMQDQLRRHLWKKQQTICPWDEQSFRNYNNLGTHWVPHSITILKVENLQKIHRSCWTHHGPKLFAWRFLPWYPSCLDWFLRLGGL